MVFIVSNNFIKNVPQATIYSCDSGTLEVIDYKDTAHYQITKQFLDDPERYVHRLFNDFDE